MAAFFALTAVMTAVLMLISVLGIVWESRFTAYTGENLQNTVDTTALQPCQAYARAHDGGIPTFSLLHVEPLHGNSRYWYPGLRLFLAWFCMTTRQMLADLVEIVTLSGPQTGDMMVYAVVQNLQVSLWNALEFGRLVLSRS